MPKKLQVKVANNWYTVEVPDIISNPVKVLVDGEAVDVDVEGLVDLLPRIETPPPTHVTSPEAQVQTLSSPLPGIVISVSVKVGDQVAPGDEVCVLEAMKMHQSIRSEWSGTVKAIHVSQGQHVGGRQPIAEIALG